MEPKLIELHVDDMRAAGLPFKTIDAARWAFRHRHQTGLAPAFKRLGTKILIDVPEFHRLMSERIA